ncbi:uncharacterized protein LOC143550763 [Bidens hawaiensis]|uniref:uncharacterized protein LOC143550763 n=1 Tax=Bidens hawaiensis TaxID=980011 RepID=UPI0040491836
MMGQDQFLLRGISSNTLSALTINEQEHVTQQIEQQEQEIKQLRTHLAEYAVKEAQIQSEKRVLETRIALMRKAFDQEQQELVEARKKSVAYRQEVIEENVRLGYALELAQEERSLFVSSLVRFLADHSLRPATLDAVSVVSNVRILFKHNKERLAITERKLRDNQYQPKIMHSMHSHTKDLSKWTPQSFYESPETVRNLPSILEDEHENENEQEQSLPHQETDDLSEDDELDINNNNNKPLPTIEGLQILGEPFPGNEIQASGYSRNGTTHCGFEWVRHFQDRSFVYIEGAKQPLYTVTADDLDTYLCVEVQPLDDRERKGEVVTCFANDHQEITCHRDMLREIENTLTLGHASFKLFVWKASDDTWEPAVLEIKKSSYNIKINGNNGFNNVVVVDNKYTSKTVISLPPEASLEFAILGSDNVEQYLCADYIATDVRCSRDTIVLTLRLFVKRAVDKKLEKKKKRRGLFFK